MIDTEYFDMAAKFAVQSLAGCDGFKINWRTAGATVHFEATYRYRRRTLPLEMTAWRDDRPQTLVAHIAEALRWWLDAIRLEIDEEITAP